MTFIKSGFSKGLRSSFAILVSLFLLSSKEMAENKPIIVENSKAVLVYHLKGGSLKDFHLKQNPLNPFQLSTNNLDVFGQSLIISNSADDLNNLEISKKAQSFAWDLTNSPIIKGKNMEMMMKGEFLGEKITVKRWITLPEDESIIEVKEEFLNYSETSASYHIFQHITLNPTLVKGASMFSNLDVQTNDSYKKVKDDSGYAWIIILSPQNNLMAGYLFNKNSYSKIVYNSQSSSSLILSSEEGKSLMQSKEQISKGYVMFLKPYDKEIKEINSINVVNGRIEIEANDGKVKLEVGSVRL